MKAARTTQSKSHACQPKPVDLTTPIQNVADDPTVRAVAEQLVRRRSELKAVLVELNGARDEYPGVPAQVIDGNTDIQYLLDGATIETLSNMQTPAGRRSTLQRQHTALTAVIDRLTAEHEAACLAAGERILKDHEDIVRRLIAAVVAASDALETKLKDLESCFQALDSAGVPSILRLSCFAFTPFEATLLNGGMVRGSLSMNRKVRTDAWDLPAKE